MSTTPTAPPEHDPLRTLLAGADPVAEEPRELPGSVWARIADEMEREDDAPSVSAVSSSPERSGRSTPDGDRRPSFARRHWQSGLLVAAGLATLALAAGTVLPRLVSSADEAAASVAGEAAVDQDAPAAGSAAGAPADSPESSRQALQDSGEAADGAAAASSAPTAAATKDPTLVRTASVIVGTEDATSARTTFVTTVEGLGGTLVSETVTAQGEGMPMSSTAMGRDMAMMYPYPSGPGIWLTVKVPAAAYDQALAAARSAGEVAQLQQSSYDVGAQVTDVRARIVVLTASLKRLQGLLGEANGVSDVIRLENAIADRQAELDSLLAQQRDLADQTQMSQISLTLLSPEDAAAAVDPDPQLTWWESFVKGLTQFWSWLGQALLVLSPLLIVGTLLWWVRRRRVHRPPAPPSDGEAAAGAA